MWNKRHFKSLYCGFQIKYFEETDITSSLLSSLKLHMKQVWIAMLSVPVQAQDKPMSTLAESQKKQGKSVKNQSTKTEMTKPWK